MYTSFTQTGVSVSGKTGKMLGGENGWGRAVEGWKVAMAAKDFSDEYPW